MGRAQDHQSTDSILPEVVTRPINTFGPTDCTHQKASDKTYTCGMMNDRSSLAFARSAYMTPFACNSTTCACACVRLRCFKSVRFIPLTSHDDTLTQLIPPATRSDLLASRPVIRFTLGEICDVRCSLSPTGVFFPFPCVHTILLPAFLSAHVFTFASSG
eukprot:6185836-Pleurochrysis_carterae.AAC.1